MEPSVYWRKQRITAKIPINQYTNGGRIDSVSIGQSCGACFKDRDRVN